MTNNILKKISVLCAAALIAAILLGIASGSEWIGLSFAHAEDYAAGDAEIAGKIKNLDIEWTSGAVTVAYHSADTVLLREKADRPIKGGDQLRWRLDGDTLRVRYRKPGIRLFGSASKDLTVTLPEGVALEDVRISAASATLRIPALQAQTLKLNVTSGDIFAAANAHEAEIGVTSGDMELKFSGAAQTIKVGSTSGNCLLEAESAETVDLGSTSGTVRAAVKTAKTVEIGSTSGDVQVLIGEAEKAKISTTSGDVQLKIARFDELTVKTSSGKIEAAVPTAPGFTARIRTASGDVGYDLPLSKQGKDYVCGDGSGEVELKTASGDITLLDAMKE